MPGEFFEDALGAGGAAAFDEDEIARPCDLGEQPCGVVRRIC
jgi:hypothetical protein